LVQSLIGFNATLIVPINDRTFMQANIDLAGGYKMRKALLNFDMLESACESFFNRHVSKSYWTCPPDIKIAADQGVFCTVIAALLSYS